MSAVKTAAQMLGSGWEGLLNHDLYQWLERVENTVRNSGELYLQESAIAAIIISWEMQNPSTPAIGD